MALELACVEIHGSIATGPLETGTADAGYNRTSAAQFQSAI
jgi:hypothetical protein